MGHIPALIDVIDVSQRERQVVFPCQLIECLKSETWNVSPSCPSVLQVASD